MQTLYKFIPSSKLTHKELAFLQLPNEVISQLSRVRDIKSVLRPLPSQFSTSFGQSSDQQILTIIQRLLSNGQWVAIGLNPRTVPITASQFASFPVIKQHVDRVKATDKPKVVKANFTAVKDDVYLAPQTSYVPVEPIPEHKIVVELAGQGRSEPTFLRLSKTDLQNYKITKPHQDIAAEHRSLAVFKALEKEPKSLYLAIPLQGRPEPLTLLLVDNIEPVDKSMEMAEWDNVLVPVFPQYYLGDDQDKNKVSLYESGYIYVLWKNKVWRELSVDQKGYFCDVELEYYRNQQAETVKKTRHVNINFFDEDRYGRLCSDDKFAIYQNGELVFEGVLDEFGSARVFGLTEDKVTAECYREDGEHLVVELDTVESPFKGGLKVLREPSGVPLSNIWVPYKIKGEVQTDLKMLYSQRQLMSSELSKLESEGDSRLVDLSGLAAYSDSQYFDADNTLVSELIASPLPDGQNVGLLKGLLGTNTAGVYLNPPAPSIRFTYLIDLHCDQSDDYFELSCVDDKWSQKVYLRETEFIDKHRKEIVFTGWLPEVEKVNLKRYCAGFELHDKQEAMSIHANIAITDLL